MGFTIDSRAFRLKIKMLLDEAEPEARRKALGAAGVQVMNDAVNQEPTVPLKEGTLRGSGSVHVEGEFEADSKDISGEGTPNKSQESTDQGVAIIGFNTPYAGYQHAGKRLDGTHVVKNYTEPSSGAGFLVMKLATRKALYMKIIANRLKKDIG